MCLDFNRRKKEIYFIVVREKDYRIALLRVVHGNIMCCVSSKLAVGKNRYCY